MAVLPGAGCAFGGKRILIVCGGDAVFAPLAFVGEWRHIAVALLDRVIIGIRSFQHLLARNSLGSGDLCDQAGPRFDKTGRQRFIQRRHHVIDFGDFAVYQFQTGAQKDRLVLVLHHAHEIRFVRQRDRRHKS